MNVSRRSLLASLPLVSCLPLRAAPSKKLQRQILESISEMPVIDSHEHLFPESRRLSEPVDYFILARHYSLNDVVSAGLSEEERALVLDTTAPLERRWQAYAPYWKHARYTGYGQAVRIAMRDIYGFDEISETTLPKLNAAIAARNKRGLYHDVLVKKAGIRYALVDDYWNPKPVRLEGEMFALARKFDQFIMPDGSKRIGELEQQTDVSITSLAGLKKAMERSFEQAITARMVTVKSTVAYSRDLRFEEVSEAEAEKEFSGLMRNERPRPQGFRRYLHHPYRKLEDHMFHHVIQLAEAYGFPVQIHTGLHAGNGNFVTNSRASMLTNLFFLYPKVTFDLFHISYPYQRELGVLAKLFPNVCLDFCWAHIISPTVSRQALHEYLDTVPVNKIFGYGGDYNYPELSYAHLVMARRNIARVLAEKVEEKVCTEDEALEIARLLLHDNAARVFPWRDS